MLHAIIMAGGSGTRFWPASRTLLPKQLLNLAGAETMIEATVNRIAALVPSDRVLIVTNKKLVEPIHGLLPKFSLANLVGEPCKRDTAPCIGLAAALVLHQDPEGVMAVMPSDHVISTDAQFTAALQQGADLVEADPDCIVTFGIKPSYPAESFGYVERGEPLTSHGRNSGAYQVQSFKEKPKTDVAKEYLASGRFYWNSGIFIWKAKTIWDALAKNEPEMFAHLDQIKQAIGKPNYAEVLDREFAAIKGKSIDFAVMEKHKNVAMIEAPFAWDDVGSWQALERLIGSDEHGNTVVGKHLALRTTGSIVRSEGGHLVVTMGLKDCLIVHTPDATLVANKHDEEAVREVVKILEQREWKEHL